MMPQIVPVAMKVKPKARKANALVVLAGSMAFAAQSAAPPPKVAQPQAHSQDDGGVEYILGDRTSSAGNP